MKPRLSEKRLRAPRNRYPLPGRRTRQTCRLCASQMYPRTIHQKRCQIEALAQKRVPRLLTAVSMTVRRDEYDRLLRLYFETKSRASCRSLKSYCDVDVLTYLVASAASGSVSADTILLSISLIRCNDLLAADWGNSSDPYCNIRIDDKTVAKTSIKYSTLNPEFNEIFHIPIKRKNFPPKKVSLCFWDYDRITANDPLGSVEIAGTPVNPKAPIDLNRPAVIQ
eukprot:7726965-Pyramimonas_sp.AAC.1